MTTPEALAARLAPLCSLLAHPARLALLYHLAAGEATVRQLETLTSIRPVVLQPHLVTLHHRGLVTRREVRTHGVNSVTHAYALAPGVRPELLALALGLAEGRAAA